MRSKAIAIKSDIHCRYGNHATTTIGTIDAFHGISRRLARAGGGLFRRSLSVDSESRAYIFLTAPKPPDIDYQAYRETRSAALLAYCHGIKVRFPQATEAIGIASEPLSERVASQDFLYVDLTEEMSPEESAGWKEMMEELDVLQAPPRLFRAKGHEFPMPFNFGRPQFYEHGSGTLMNRAERRRMAREAQKEAKKARKRSR